MGTGGGDYSACADNHRTLEYLSSFSSSLIELVCTAENPELRLIDRQNRWWPRAHGHCGGIRGEWSGGTSTAGVFNF